MQILSSQGAVLAACLVGLGCVGAGGDEPDVLVLATGTRWASAGRQRRLPTPVRKVCLPEGPWKGQGRQNIKESTCSTPK